MSAKGIIENTLARYGLGSLADWAWKRWLGGDSIEEIMLEMRTRKEYKARFPAMEELGKQGRAISEEAYISYEQSIRNLVSQHGLDMTLYGARSYIADLLLKDISPAEAQSRMELAEAASTTAPMEYRQAASRLYGISSAQWASIWLETDKTLPKLEKQFAASMLAGEVTMANLGDLSKAMSERLVEAGIGRDQARQGTSRLSPELVGRLPGEVESGLGTDTAFAGSVGVGDAAAKLRRRVNQRISQFAGGGGAATTEEGAVGLRRTQR